MRALLLIIVILLLVGGRTALDGATTQAEPAGLTPHDREYDQHDQHQPKSMETADGEWRDGVWVDFDPIVPPGAERGGPLSAARPQRIRK